MHSSSALLVVQSIVFMLMTQHSAAQVNYTCLASAAISTSSSQAAAVGSCLNNANGALTATSIKACIKSTKTKDKTAKKPQALFYKCLNAYWKAVTVLAKTNSSISAATTSCLASTGSYDSCKLATIVGASNAKLAKKATKADAKWTGKKCAGILTPAGCSIASAASTTTTTVNGSSTTTALTTTTAATGTTTTTTPATTATTTAGTAGTTTTAVPCSAEYCQTQCLSLTCDPTIASQATDIWNNKPDNVNNQLTFTCASNAVMPAADPLQDGILSVTYTTDGICDSAYVYSKVNTPDGPGDSPDPVDSGDRVQNCTLGTGAQSWNVLNTYNYTGFYCLNTA